MSDPYAPPSNAGYPEIHHHHHYHESPSADLVAEVAAQREQIVELKNLIGAVLPEIITSLNAVHFGQEQLEEEMALDLSALESEVAENTTVVDSASALLASLAQEIRDAAGDPARITAIADALDANTARLADAVETNTPGAGGGGPTGAEGPSGAEGEAPPA